MAAYGQLSLVFLWLQGFQLGGLLAAVAAGAIGGIPFMGGEDKRTYERYHLKRDSKTRV
jgi:hypothetical protein